MSSPTGLSSLLCIGIEPRGYEAENGAEATASGGLFILFIKIEKNLGAFLKNRGATNEKICKAKAVCGSTMAVVLAVRNFCLQKDTRLVSIKRGNYSLEYHHKGEKRKKHFVEKKQAERLLVRQWQRSFEQRPAKALSSPPVISGRMARLEVSKKFL